MEIEEIKFPINIKDVTKGLEIYGFVIVDYSVRKESDNIIVLRY